MKKIDVLGLGNALVDLLFECSNEEFQELAMEKGGMRLIAPEVQQQMLSKLGDPVRMVSGGSVANSVSIVAQLGGKSALIGSVAQDRLGEFFVRDLADFGVIVSANGSGPNNHETGTSVVVVTPDAERTMSTALGASSELNGSHIQADLIADSRWILIEGYVIANSSEARDAILKLVGLAKESGTKIAITLSDGFIVNCFRDFLDQLLPQVDLIFCNDVESAALCGESDTKAAFDKLTPLYKGLVITAGKDGAHFSFAGEVGHTEAFLCTPVDLTGAGDAFAGAFLHAICNGQSALNAAKKGCFYASKVIQQWGARLGMDMGELDKEFVSVSV